MAKKTWYPRQYTGGRDFRGDKLSKRKGKFWGRLGGKGKGSYQDMGIRGGKGNRFSGWKLIEKFLKGITGGF